MKASKAVLATVAVILLAVGTMHYLGVDREFAVGSEREVTATTTTSLYATGLLDYLGSQYYNRTGWKISFIPVGSGEALRRASDGEACLVLVHAPSLEKHYIDAGVLEYHKIFAYNYFVIVGPANDPANVSNAKSVEEAMKQIYIAGERGEALFISRGDNSGTNVKERELWRNTGLDPSGKKWYLESGSGMGQTLIMAEEKAAYTLSDIGTYLKFKKDGRISHLTILYENDSTLINIYSAYLVKSCTGSEKEAAKGFIDFITSPEGQELIGNYGKDKYGQSLFHPASGEISYLEEMWKKLAGIQG